MAHLSGILFDPNLFLCWGKTGEAPDLYHPALYHLLDVGHVAQCLLGDPASVRWRVVLGRSLGALADDLIDWLPWFVAMHDIGKISVPFQAQSFEQYERLKDAGFDFGRWVPAHRVPHTLVGTAVLRAEFTDLGLPDFLYRAWSEMIGGHHGSYESVQQRKETRQVLRAIQEPSIWAKWRKQAAGVIENALLYEWPENYPSPPNLSVAIAALTGFAILCDWLGSDQRYFSPQPKKSLEEYIEISRQQALTSVAAAGFHSPIHSNALTAFADLFPQRAPGRPLQRTIDRIPDDALREPCLAIIEAPTGEGKTEAALALAHRIGRLRGTDEFYYALPTMATSNQMFGRVQGYIVDQLSLPRQVKLIHGQSFLVEDDLAVAPSTNGVEAGVHPALEWFSPKKRALLAPFGVGTIDQAELAALNVRHQALRLWGLAGKVVILDEVHAYDTYMTTITARLLNWLQAMGTSVILLSATLPLARRRGLALAYAQAPTHAPQNDGYPSLWVGGSSGIYEASPAAHHPDHHLHLNSVHWAHADSEAKASWLLDLVSEGGCACWITNTVKRAQQLYVAVCALDPGCDCRLLHAQFPLEERQRRENHIASTYGPTGSRPSRGIVIGTQVLEQSLDLDFDVMVSDLAPIDLLLQRAGRLHRHERTRSPAHNIARLWIEVELDDSGDIRFGEDRFYSEYILHKTWHAVRERDSIHLPRDYRTLIELVYDEEEPADDSLAGYWQQLKADQAHERDEATLRLVGMPNPVESFTIAPRIEFKEDEEGVSWIVAQTRLGPESITVIPLTRSGHLAEITPGEWVDLTRPASRNMQLRLLRRGVRLSQATAVQALKYDPAPLPPLFVDSPLLRNVKPLWLEAGGTRLTAKRRTVILWLDGDLGLVIERGRAGAIEME